MANKSGECHLLSWHGMQSRQAEATTHKVHLFGPKHLQSSTAKRLGLLPRQALGHLAIAGKYLAERHPRVQTAAPQRDPNSSTTTRLKGCPWRSTMWNLAAATRASHQLRSKRDLLLLSRNAFRNLKVPPLPTRLHLSPWLQRPAPYHSAPPVTSRHWVCACTPCELRFGLPVFIFLPNDLRLRSMD